MSAGTWEARRWQQITLSWSYRELSDSVGDGNLPPAFCKDSNNFQLPNHLSNPNMDFFVRTLSAWHQIGAWFYFCRMRAMKRVLEGRGVLRALGCRSGLAGCVSSGPLSVKPETGSPSLYFILSQEGGRGESRGWRKRGRWREREKRGGGERVSS